MRLGNIVPMCVNDEEGMGLVIMVVASGAFRIWGKFVSLLLDSEPAWTLQTKHHPRSALITLVTICLSIKLRLMIHALRIDLD